jgi:hypothetical protein
MNDIIIYVNAAGFLLMGIVGLVNPTRITSYFKVPVITSDMRNEIRAVYGGFGIAMAAALAGAVQYEEYRVGILATISTALLGMACGRIVSFAIERDVGKYPYIYLCVELVMGGSLAYVLYT